VQNKKMGQSRKAALYCRAERKIKIENNNKGGGRKKERRELGLRGRAARENECACRVHTSTTEK